MSKRNICHSHVIFVTGNADKARYFSKVTDIEVEHKQIDIEEIQSLDLSVIVKDKARRAFVALRKPVIVEDVSLEITAFNGLPGPFIKWFLERMSARSICEMVPLNLRAAVARCQIAYFDGAIERLFEGRLCGEIAVEPMGDDGFGWDSFFIPKGYNLTRAELAKEDDEKTYLQLKPFNEVASFLKSLK